MNRAGLSDMHGELYNTSGPEIVRFVLRKARAEFKQPDKRAGQIVRELGTDKANASAEILRLRTALEGIARYGKMCKGTDAERMTYLAEQVLAV